MRAILRKTRSLRAQLTILLTLALFPLGLISLSQTWAVLRDASYIQKSNEVASMANAAAAEREKIERALGAGLALDAVVHGVDRQMCTRVMRLFISGQSEYVSAGVIEANGALECSSLGQIGDLSGDPAFQTAMLRGKPLVDVIPAGAVTGGPEMIVHTPIRVDGRLDGFVSISFPHALEQTLAEAVAGTQGLALIMLNSAGATLAATETEALADYMPATLSAQDLFGRAGETFYATTGSGSKRLFAVSTLVEDAVVLVGSWPRQTNASILLSRQVVIPLTLPVLMWLAGMVVGFYGVERLVLRHVRALNSAIRRFALGARGGEALQLAAAPEEMQDAARAFNRMTMIMTEAELRREQDLHDKEVLLREVHHRVKNNLQLIASMMNMHARTATSPETHTVLAGLQRRLRSMAMLHRSLYTSTEMTTVDGAALIRALVDETQELASARQSDLEVHTDLAAVALYPDQAVPLTMLLAELLTNAAKYVGRPADGPARLSITFRQEGAGQLVLEVCNTLGARLTDDEDPLLGSTGVGSGLTRAFVAQLEGTLETEETAQMYRVEIRFERADFDLEERAA